jgi:hypothetical protein
MAVARPMPRAAPVITATLPRRHPSGFIVVALFVVIGVSYRFIGFATLVQELRQSECASLSWQRYLRVSKKVF